MPNLQIGYKKKSIREEYNQQDKKETEDMVCKKNEKSENNLYSENFFWNLFLKTGRIDAYLLLKEEESEQEKNTLG